MNEKKINEALYSTISRKFNNDLNNLTILLIAQNNSTHCRECNDTFLDTFFQILLISSLSNNRIKVNGFNFLLSKYLLQ